MMTSRSIALFLAVMLVPLQEASSEDEDKVALKMVVNKIDVCPEYPNPSFDFQDLQMEMDPDTDIVYVSGILNASEPLEEGTKGKVKLFRCMNEDEKSCEKYVDLEVDDFCKYLPQEDKEWSAIVEHLQGFDPHCPVKPGVYELHEAPLKTKNSTSSQAMVGHWQMKVVIDYQETVMACMYADMDISASRRKNGRK